MVPGQPPFEIPESWELYQIGKVLSFQQQLVTIVRAKEWIQQTVNFQPSAHLGVLNKISYKSYVSKTSKKSS